MAYDYNRAKQVWDSMNDQQKKQYTEQNKNDANFQQFAQQYHEEKQQTAPRQVQANVNVDNLQNNQPQKQQQVINTQTESEQQPLAQRDANGVYTGNTEWEKEQNRRMLQDQSSNQGVTKTITPQEMQESINKAQDQIKNQNASPEFDSSRLTNPNAEVSVKEGKAAQTGTPDYEEDSEARMNEITNNLNAYWNTNKSYFSDRATFNSTFHYNDRSDKQKALLDSFWKGTQDQIKANSYHNGDEIMSGFENGDITPDIMSYLRTYNEAAYDEWQKKMEDKVNTLIANMAAPRDVWDTAELWQNIVKKFGLEAGDPYDIYGEWSRRAEELGVFRDSQQLASMSNNIASIYSTMNSNVQSISSQLEGRYSAGYIAARIDKANSKLNAQAKSMQYSYNLLLQNRNQNMAIAQQAAAMKQAQGQEDSRIFNQKLAGLGFAMQADSYRTPEQQAQLQLQTQSILNDINLINQGNKDQLDLYKQRQLNQLEITHMHDLAEAQDQINFERTDLTVENEGLLRKNLSNVLDEYYSKFGDMIQRPKSQVIEDVLAYARNNNVSVAEALKKDFIEPLQGKTEYKNMLASKYAAPVKSGVTVNSDGSIDFGVTTEGGLTYTPITSTQLYGGFRDFVDSKKVGDMGGQCGKFVNDYLQSMGFSRIYKDSISSKLNSINTDKNDLDNLSVGSVAVFDYAGVNGVSENSKKYGHVAIVTEIDKANNRVKVIESNNKGDEKISTRWVSLNGNALKGFFDPSKGSNTPSDNLNYQSLMNNLSTTDRAKAEGYFKQLEMGNMNNSDITKITDWMAVRGLGDVWNQKMNLGREVPLGDAQLEDKKEYLSRFYGSTAVKNFESAKDEFGKLVSALNDNSGVGDMSAIFSFMKTLDPKSVVRGEEFDSAANTIGVANWDAILQKLEKAHNGKFLTPEQREQFKRVARDFIDVQAQSYQDEYNYLVKMYGVSGIPGDYLPDNFAQMLIDRLNGKSSDGGITLQNVNNTQNTTINWYEQYTSGGNNNQVYSDGLPNNFYSFGS